MINTTKISLCINLKPNTIAYTKSLTMYKLYCL